MKARSLGLYPTGRVTAFFWLHIFQIDNWAPLNFLSDVHMPTEELVFNSFHFKVVWF